MEHQIHFPLISGMVGVDFFSMTFTLLQARAAIERKRNISYARLLTVLAQTPTNFCEPSGSSCVSRAFGPFSSHEDTTGSFMTNLPGSPFPGQVDEVPVVIFLRTSTRHFSSQFTPACPARVHPKFPCPPAPEGYSSACKVNWA